MAKLTEEELQQREEAVRQQEEALRQKRRDKLEEFQLRELEASSAKRESTLAERQVKEQAYQDALKNDAAAEKNRQASCLHRKGGKGKARFLQGNDQNYSVITHTLPLGDKIVTCTRCGAIFEAPKALPKNASNARKEHYKQQMRIYREALGWPTDNEESGNQIFLQTATVAPDPDEFQEAA